MAQASQFRLYAIYTLRPFNEVCVFFRCELQEGRFGIGAESLDARLFAPHDLPWRQIGLTPVREALRQWSMGSRTDDGRVHSADLELIGAGRWLINRFLRFGARDGESVSSIDLVSFPAGVSP